MQKADFCFLEHHLPERIGLSPDEIRKRRNELLKKGEDWDRVGRWIKYSEGGVRKLKGQVGVAEIKPEPPKAQWVDAEVTRCNFPNHRIIEVRQFETGKLWSVRIHPEWRDRYRPKMKIQILANGERVATTKRPRERYKF